MAANHAVVMSFQLLAKNELWKRSWPGGQEPASQSSTHVRILGRLADDVPFSLLAGTGEEGIVNHISNIFFSVPSLLFWETEDQSYQRIYPDIPVRQTKIGWISKSYHPGGRMDTKNAVLSKSTSQDSFLCLVLFLSKLHPLYYSEAEGNHNFKPTNASLYHWLTKRKGARPGLALFKHKSNCFCRCWYYLEQFFSKDKSAEYNRIYDPYFIHYFTSQCNQPQKVAHQHWCYSVL